MTKSNTTTGTCSPAQRRFLLKELMKYNRFEIRRRVDLPDTKEVLQARKHIARLQKVIDRHEGRRQKMIEKKEEEHTRLKSAAQKAVHFDTPDAARRALEKVEEFWSKLGPGS